jgi:uncharacterized membrane protein (UPF0136 family)
MLRYATPLNQVAKRFGVWRLDAALSSKWTPAYKFVPVGVNPLMGNENAAVESVLSPDSENPPTPPPFYRPIDWQTFALTSPLLLIVYWLTLVSDVTLDDAGELVTAAMWLGVPNPPGYPVWTLLTWFFIHLIPISTIAWRVALASAVEAALACGLCGLMASRFTGLMIDGIARLEKIDRPDQNAICAVAGFIAALSLGFNRTMWSQAVIPSIYPLATLSLVVTLLVLFRWMYSPEKRQYVYWAAFLFGICVVNHQTLIVVAMGLEIAIIAADAKLGRDLLVVNVLCWVSGLSLNGWPILTVSNAASPRVFALFNIIGALSMAATLALIIKTKKFLTEWKSVLAMAGLWLVGISFYIIVPLLSMTNPPMNWGYARTPEGFLHAISRGQYDSTYPADIIHSPELVLGQIAAYLSTTTQQFGLEYIPLAFLPFLCFFKIRKRERRWMTSLVVLFLCMGILLTILLNPTRDRTTTSLIKVFYMPSYVPIALWIGCGTGLATAWLAVRFPRAQAR